MERERERERERHIDRCSPSLPWPSTKRAPPSAPTGSGTAGARRRYIHN